MLPAVTTGPMDPAWSPDGRWIAFSMRGDIWKVLADGGQAIALTAGPAYHFEPAWNPDGHSIALALAMDVDGNLDIGVVSADGGPVERVTTDSAVDVEPAWGADGAALFFVSARERGFAIYRNVWGSLVERRPDGAATRAFRVHQVDPFLRWLLSLQGEAVVESPAELADALRTLAREVAGMYEE